MTRPTNCGVDSFSSGWVLRIRGNVAIWKYSGHGGLALLGLQPRSFRRVRGEGWRRHSFRNAFCYRPCSRIWSGLGCRIRQILRDGDAMSDGGMVGCPRVSRTLASCRAPECGQHCARRAEAVKGERSDFRGTVATQRREVVVVVVVEEEKDDVNNTKPAGSHERQGIS